MTTSELNALRKQVFAYVRKYSGHYDYKPYAKFGKSKAVLAMVAEAEARVSANAEIPTIKKQFIASLRNRCKDLASCLPSSGYSMGEVKSINCRDGAFKVSSCDLTIEYARSCSWRAKHGSVIAILPIRMLRKAESLDGMITIRGKQVQDRIWKAEWVVFDPSYNGRGILTSSLVGWHTESGYVVRREDGRCNGWSTKAGWYHCETLALARVALREFKAAENNLAKEALKAARHDRDLKKMGKASEIVEALSYRYCYLDSIKAGNCIPGTNAFIVNHNLDKDAQVSGSVLIHLTRSSQRRNVVAIITKWLKDNKEKWWGRFGQVATEYLMAL